MTKETDGLLHFFEPTCLLGNPCFAVTFSNRPLDTVSEERERKSGVINISYKSCTLDCHEFVLAQSSTVYQVPLTGIGLTSRMFFFGTLQQLISGRKLEPLSQTDNIMK